MPEEALDMSLDDLVQGDKSSGKGRGNKGGGKGKSWKLWGKGSSKDGGDRKGGKGKGKRSWDNNKENGDGNKEKSSDKDSGPKLDMSLDEVISKDKGSGRGGNSEGKGKGRGKGKSSKGKSKSYDDWNSRESSWGGYNQEKGNSDRKGSKGSKKGGSSYSGNDRGNYSPADPSGAQWSQHDDRADDSDDGGKGWGGKGKGSARNDRRPGGGGGAGAPRAWSDDRRDTGAWQRVEQPKAPMRERREMGRDREERVRDTRRAAPAETRSAPQGQKRRATEEPEGSRSVKSIKVTNIPRDVNVNDIRDAFESETGKIARCRLDRGTAWIAFATSTAARKAVETFDRGELNGQNIGVTLDR